MTNKYSFKFINLSAWFIISLLFNNVSAQTVTTMGSGFTNPYDVAVDNNGNIYVADYGNSKVKKMVECIHDFHTFHFNESSYRDLDYDFSIIGYSQGDQVLIKKVGTDKRFNENEKYNAIHCLRTPSIH